MTLPELRTKHPQFIYESFVITQKELVLTIQFHFILTPDIHFYPEIRIPVEQNVDIDAIRLFVFHLGMVEAISYWKVACPPEFVVNAGYFDSKQISWWHDLFIQGLGEFYYRNGIDFTGEDFLTIRNESNKTNWSNTSNARAHKYDGDLVLVGGGKDSAVMLEQLKHTDPGVLLVNPTIAAQEIARISGVKRPIVVHRMLDKELFSLNTRGYLNGHTPFSALLAFLGVLVAELYSCKRVVVANEQSASEGNVVFHGLEINHQYSKSAAFEQKFREYLHSFVIPDLIRDPVSESKNRFRLGGRNDNYIDYYSYLRQFNNLQISHMFSQMPQYFSAFRSCNVGSKKNTWCGACPKCAFTYLVLFPYISYTDMMGIFGNDYFQNPAIIQYVSELVGLEPIKPFECVGTRAESTQAVRLCVEKYNLEQREVPIGLLAIWKKL